MQSSNHIGNIVRQHADAVQNGKSSARKPKAKRPSGNPFNTVPKHRAFVPMVTIWGGLLLALITAVLPDQAIARASSITGVYLPLIVTRIILAACLGLSGAVLGFIVASALSNRAKMVEGDGVLVSAFKSRDREPINPAADLGSESLDAPFEEPFSIELAAQDDLPVEFASLEANQERSPEGSSKGSPKDSGQAFNTQEREPKLGELARRGYEMDAPDEDAPVDDRVDADDNIPEGTYEDTTQDRRHAKGNWAFTRKHFKEALIDSCEGATCEAASGEKTSRWDKSQWDKTSDFDTDRPVPGDPETRPGFASLTEETLKPSSATPRSLDLGEFGALPGRNAVWVEEPARPQPQPQPQPQPHPHPNARAQTPLSEPTSAEEDAPKAAPTNALEKLRQKPASDLSLVEMVERFAGALHERQAHERVQMNNGQITDGQIERETALTEALKALSLFTQAGFDKADQRPTSDSQIDQTQDELRGALERLQDLRGAG